MQWSRSRRALTLIELVVVLAIVALIAGVALASFRQAQTQASNNASMAQAQSLAQAVSAFYAVNGCYPGDAGTAGTMPSGMSSYVGGTWPAGYEYSAWGTYPWGSVPGGRTASWILVIAPYGGSGQPATWQAAAVWVVNGSAVTTC